MVIPSVTRLMCPPVATRAPWQLGFDHLLSLTDPPAGGVVASQATADGNKHAQSISARDMDMLLPNIVTDRRECGDSSCHLPCITAPYYTSTLVQQVRPVLQQLGGLAIAYLSSP